MASAMSERRNVVIGLIRRTQGTLNP